jgi:hypothetical protein
MSINKRMKRYKPNTPAIITIGQLANDLEVAPKTIISVLKYLFPKFVTPCVENTYLEEYHTKAITKYIQSESPIPVPKTEMKYYSMDAAKKLGISEGMLLYYIEKLYPDLLEYSRSGIFLTETQIEVIKNFYSGQESNNESATQDPDMTFSQAEVIKLRKELKKCKEIMEERRIDENFYADSLRKLYETTSNIGTSRDYFKSQYLEEKKLHEIAEKALQNAGIKIANLQNELKGVLPLNEDDCVIDEDIENRLYNIDTVLSVLKTPSYVTINDLYTTLQKADILDNFYVPIAKYVYEKYFVVHSIESVDAKFKKHIDMMVFVTKKGLALIKETLRSIKA